MYVMLLVRILGDNIEKGQGSNDRPEVFLANLLRQTPGQSGVWNGYQFTTENVEVCDCAIIINQPHEDARVLCPQENIWAFAMVPPCPEWRGIHWGDRQYSRVYTTDSTILGQQYFLSQIPRPWTINKTYDDLKDCSLHSKERTICLIDSLLLSQNKKKFFEKINSLKSLDIISSSDDRWECLSKYKYTIIYEDFINDHYWSEHLTDALLSWTIPIYVGCRRIHDFFPSDAIITIDANLDDPVQYIENLIAKDNWYMRLNALEHARNLILDQYQLFPMIAKEIVKQKKKEKTIKDKPSVLSVLPKKITPKFSFLRVAEQILTPSCVNLIKKHANRNVGRLRSGYAHFIKQEKWSICTGIRNRNAMLDMVLRSWLDCYLVDEIIIVDWSSEEDVVGVVSSYKDSRIRVARVDGESKYNYSAVNNLKVRLSSNEKIFITDCDIKILKKSFLLDHKLEIFTWALDRSTPYHWFLSNKEGGLYASKWIQRILN
jgi:Glycosyltransferase family 10 (fucosyltransferase) C-term